MPLEILGYLLLLISAAFVGGTLLKTLKQPPVVGYLLAGLTLGILLGDKHVQAPIAVLSELGIVLLLFTLGLEFSWSRLRKVARIAVFGGIAQIVATTVIATVFISQLGFSLYAALFMAMAFSLSSTAVVVKILADRGELDTLPGEIMVAWLIVQDLAVLPIIIILPSLGRELQLIPLSSSSLLLLLQQIGLAVTVLVSVIISGRIVVPRIVEKIAALNSRELLLVGVFGIAVAGALLTQKFGLSAALGAFLAGVLISQSAQTHAVFSEIRPLRDIFALLFFTTLGVMLPQGFFFSHFGQILAVTVGVTLIKFIVVAILTLYLGYHARTSFLVGVGLIEVGEFAFILSSIGLTEGVITLETHGMILSVALMSILIMPPLFLTAPLWYRRIRDLTKEQFRPLYVRFFAGVEHRDTLPELPYKDHVVLCGYGRVGKYIGRALEMTQIPYVVIEYNHDKARILREQGVTAIYGDPADIDILDYAQVDKARAVVIAIPDLHTQSQVITNSLTLNKNVDIFCRTHHESDQKHIKALGVTAVIQPEFEAALSITDKILKSFGQKEEDIEGKVSRLKIEHGLG